MTGRVHLTLAYGTLIQTAPHRFPEMIWFKTLGSKANRRSPLIIYVEELTVTCGEQN